MSSEISNIENQYLNIVIPHEGNTTNFTAANYTRNNTNSLVFNPRQYKLAVTRFQIPVSSIPLFVFENNPDGPINDSVYTVYLFEKQNPTVVWSANVQYIPRDCELNGNQPYYYVYSYVRFLEMINQTLIQLASDASLPLGAPQFYYDYENQTVFLSISNLFLDNFANGWNFYVNDKLYRFFDGFEVQRNNGSVFDQIVPPLSRSLLIFQIIVRSLYDNVDPLNANNYIVKSELKTLSSWNSLRSLQIQSNLPINNEYIDLEYATGRPTNAENVLQDFIVNYPDSNPTARTSVEYSVNEFTYIDLFGDEPIRNIQIQIYWVDIFGIKRQHVLRSGEVCFIRLMFKSKYLI
jgi:hypothetical protein